MFFLRLFNPRLACWKRGEHTYRRRKKRIMRPGRGYRCVAEECIRSRNVCTCCGHESKIGVEERVVDSYTGITMPKDMYDLMHRRGWVDWD